MSVVDVDRVFAVEADIHPADYDCSGVSFGEPFGHANLPDDLVLVCRLDSCDVVIQSIPGDDRRLTLTVWHVGTKGHQLAVGSVSLGDRCLRLATAGWAFFARVSEPDWPMARVTVELAESLDLASVPRESTLDLTFGVLDLE